MKKILSATLALIMLMLSLVSCGESSEYEIPEGLQLVRESKEDGYVFFGPDGWQIANELDDSECIHICKESFGWKRWDDCYFKEVELVGLCTDICVVSNALIIKAMFPNAQVQVDAACCAGVTPESHQAAIKTMQMGQVEVV